MQTLLDSGVDTSFMNPGTSEMHFVAALDDVPEMRGILTLFEGVATGAADGFGRMADRPASTLLHLGAGLGNGIANLHNARRAKTPLVNIVGDHAVDHKQYDAPLESDIETLARNFSGWIRTSQTSAAVAQDTAEAVAASMSPPGQVATLILPADTCWGESDGPAEPIAMPSRSLPTESEVLAVAALLQDSAPDSVMILLGGTVGRVADIEAASRIAEKASAKVLMETFPTRLERGAGRPPIERLAYLADFARLQLDGIKHLVLVGATSPVAFFAYPGQEGSLVPAGCEVHTLATADQDCTAALEAVAESVDAPVGGFVAAPLARPEIPDGELTALSVSQVVGALLPEGAIVSDESNMTGIFLPGATQGAPEHDWLCLTGGGIGQGMPVATGAAVACPDRRVVNMQADGSAMYTIQSLWTQAREGLDVTTIIFNNGSYAVLNMELDRVGAQAPGPKARSMFDISGPRLDFVAMAGGMGVPATRATTTKEFADQLSRSLSTAGPSLVEVMLPATL